MMVSQREKTQVLFQTHDPSHSKMSRAKIEEPDAFAYRITSSNENNYGFGHH